MAKLDKKDKKILYELDKNSRQPLTKIARKVGLSRETVLYRLRKYIEKGIIRNYLSVINMSKLGFTHHKIYLKLQNISEAEEMKMINFLSKNPFVSWVASCDGGYSLIYAPKARTMQELNKIIMEVNNKFGKFIKEQDTSTIIDAHHFYRDYLVDKRADIKREIIWGGTPENVKLDENNIAILNEISKDSRINAIDIAHKLGISSDSVIQRIKKLERASIIEHFMIWPNVNGLNRIFNKVLISLRKLDGISENKIIDYCLKNPNIIYAVKCLGSWQIELDIESKNIEEFRGLIRNFMKTFHDIVSDYTSLTIYDEYKYCFFEKECFDSVADAQQA